MAAKKKPVAPNKLGSKKGDQKNVPPGTKKGGPTSAPGKKGATPPATRNGGKKTPPKKK